MTGIVGPIGPTQPLNIRAAAAKPANRVSTGFMGVVSERKMGPDGGPQGEPGTTAFRLSY